MNEFIISQRGRMLIFGSELVELIFLASLFVLIFSRSRSLFLGVACVLILCMVFATDRERETLTNLNIDGEASLSLQGSYLITLIDPAVEPAHILDGIGTAENPDCDDDGECTATIRYKVDPRGFPK